VLAWKLRIVVLWISLAACQSVSVTLVLLQPGVLRDLMAGHVAGVDVQSAGVQVATAIPWLVPMVMAYLTLVLRDDIDRRTNALLGGGGALYGVSALTTPPTGPPVAQGVGVLAILVNLLIVWHAWKWPRPSGAPTGSAAMRTTQR
jgi:hypothetical protein